MSGTISACARIVVVSEPVPVSVRVTVVGLVHPEASVMLPLSPGARPTTVIAGALPVPWYAIVIVKCVLSVIANPVALTLATVLNARKVSVELPSWSQLGGPFKPAHCWPLVVVVCGVGLVAAKALLSP